MGKILNNIRNIAMIIGLMLSSASFIIIGGDKQNQAIVNLGALTFLIFTILFFIELILLSIDN